MSCQLFGTIDGREVSASFPEMIKYAADAGAVIAQNSWGYENITYLPRADQEAIDYYLHRFDYDQRPQRFLGTRRDRIRTRFAHPYRVHILFLIFKSQK